jgi:hypothetical protein
VQKCWLSTSTSTLVTKDAIFSKSQDASFQ